MTLTLLFIKSAFFRFLALWVISFLVANVGLAKDNALIELEALGCGAHKCPEYSIKIFSDGHTKYSGQRNVALVGSRQLSLTSEQVELLVKRSEHCGFFSTHDNSKLSKRAILAVAMRGRDKEVEKYIQPIYTNDCRTGYILECAKYETDKSAMSAGIQGDQPVAFQVFLLRIRGESRITGGCVYPHLNPIVQEIQNQTNARHLVHGGN